MKFHRTVFPNGLTVLTEPMPHVRSLSMGVWLKSGSRNETEKLNGITHFIEHMLFKGTMSRSAAQIASEMDSLGGNLQAFTGKETVSFQCKVLDSHFEKAFNILSDLVLNPRFDPHDIQREKKVIYEEIKMDEDNPDLLVHELFTQNYFPKHPLGRSILGTRNSLRKITENHVRHEYTRNFSANNLVITAAGRLDNKRFLDMVRNKFGPIPRGEKMVHRKAPRANPTWIVRRKKSLEQVQICIGMPAPAAANEDRFATHVLNVILGGSMSSRLFQKVREEQGLAYSIYSDLSSYHDTGVMLVFAGTSKASARKVIQAVIKEAESLRATPPTKQELRLAKDHLKGNMMLGLESSTSRMSLLARQEMYFKEFPTLDQILRKIESVTAENILAVSKQMFRPGHMAVTLLGDIREFNQNEILH